MKQFLAGESEGFPEGLFSQALGNANVATLMDKKFFRSILLFVIIYIYMGVTLSMANLHHLVMFKDQSLRKSLIYIISITGFTQSHGGCL